MSAPVPSLGPPVVRIRPDPATAGPVVAWPLGARLDAEVIRSDESGHALLEIGHRRVWASSTGALRPGDRLHLEVARADSVVELRLVPSGGVEARAASSETLPRLLEALASIEAEPAAARTDRIASAVERLLARAPELLGARDAEALEAVIGRLAASGSAAELARSLAARVEQGGSLWERHLRLLLETGVAPSEAVDRLRGDLRALLGRLARRAEAESPWAREGGDRGGASASVANLAEALGETVLDRQIDTAVRWIRDGDLAFDLPLRLGGEASPARVRLVLDRRQERGRRASADDPARIEVRVETRALGQVAARVTWSGRRAVSVVAVDRLETRDLFGAHLGELAERLSALGAGAAQVEVVFNPLSAGRSDPGLEPARQAAGVILDVKA